MIRITYQNLKKYAYVAIALPFLIFAIGWLKWTWALAISLALIFCCYMALAGRKKEVSDNSEHTTAIELSSILLVIAVLIAAFWVWQSGIGGMWAQSKDYPWRNATFRDLILRDWPVYYESYGGALAYYIGYWLPAAAFGKIAYMLGASESVAFQIGNFALYLWSVYCITLIFLLAMLTVKADTRNKQILTILLFVFFSGMDALGSIQPLGASLYHIEWWAEFAQYSSFSTCLFWVFNQSVIPWICMLCLLQEKNTSGYVFLGMGCLFNGPLPFVGFFVYCIFFGIQKTIVLAKEQGWKESLKCLVSVSNLISCLVLFPVIGSFLLCNNAVNGGNLRLAQSMIPNRIQTEYFLQSVKGAVAMGVSVDGAYWFRYVKFVLLEFGIYALLIARKYYRNLTFWVTVVSLLLFPFFKIGYQADFPMRASIPALLVLYILCLRFLFEESKVLGKEYKKKIPNSYRPLLYKILIICLVIGTWTAQVEFIRGVRQVVQHGIHWSVTDFVYTLGGDGPYQHGVENGSSYPNCICSYPEESVFFTYFAKELR